MFIILPVQDFCALVFLAEAQFWSRRILAALSGHLTSTRFLCIWFVRLRPNFGPDPPWPHLDSDQDRSGPIGPCGPVMQATYQMFII